MKVYLHELAAGRQQYDLQLEPREIGLENGADYALIGTIAAHLSLARAGERVLLTGSLKARVRMECVRCLKPLELELENPQLAVVFLPALAHEQEVQRGPEILDSDEDDLTYYSKDELLLDDVLREHLLVELPAYPRCEPECAGMNAAGDSAQEALPDWKRKLKQLRLD